MKSVQIQGREYIPVNERIKEFRSKHPNFSLLTELVDVNADHALIKAKIVDDNGKVLAEGTAYEKAGSSFINKGSHVENCETSAWGRALGNLGIGIDASVASADEVANAVVNQNAPKKSVPKKQPTKVYGMEYLNAAKNMMEAATVYGQLMKYQWSEEDAKDLTECYQNVAKKFPPDAQ